MSYSEVAGGRLVSLQSGHQPQFLVGLNANKSSSPGIGDTYYATDTATVYVCFSAGVWTAISGSVHLANGNYTGNGTQNRTVAHGCAATPKFVIVQANNATKYAGFWVSGVTFATQGISNTGVSATEGIQAVDGTNITVGSDASGSNLNINLLSYMWVAIL